MLYHLLIALILLLIVLSPVRGDEAEHNQYIIRPSDIPADAPRFEDYPAKLYQGTNAEPDLRSHPRSRLFRTRLKDWAQQKPNFAGHFILATWGCGTDCTHLAIIDVQTGKIFHPPGATMNAAVNVHPSLFRPGDIFEAYHGSGAIWFRADSRLLVLIGMPEERVENRGISYYVWEKNRLERIRFVHKAWYPNSK